MYFKEYACPLNLTTSICLSLSIALAASSFLIYELKDTNFILWDSVKYVLFSPPVYVGLKISPQQASIRNPQLYIGNMWLPLVEHF